MVSTIVSIFLGILISLVLQALLGTAITQVFCYLSKHTTKTFAINTNVINLPVVLTIGIILHLHFVWALELCNFSWLISTLLPLLFGLPAISKLKSILKNTQFQISLPFALWAICIVLLGLSLFNTTTGIQTPWVNNYGDLAFHIGMISSFTFGHNFPIDYHIFANESMSYPFLINLWTSALWWISPNTHALSMVFQYQWFLVWTLVYIFLKGNKYPWLPWTILLGGGSYSLLFDHIAANIAGIEVNTTAHDYIALGHPWAPFISTIWVTQRTTLLGLVTSLCSLNIFYHWYSQTPQKHFNNLGTLIYAFLLSFSGTLAHTHFTMVTLLFEVTLLLWTLVSKHSWSQFQEIFYFKTARQFILLIGLLVLSITPVIIAVIQLASKSNLIAFVPGWFTYTYGATVSSVALQTSQVWLTNAWPWFLLICVLLYKTRNIGLFLTICLLFIAGNSIRLSIWEWDQIKFFLGLYIICIYCVSSYPKRSVILHFLCPVLLCIPALYELKNTFYTYQLYSVYSAAEIDLAHKIRRSTPDNAIIVAAPLHNSVVTLTGRKLYYGYEGTLQTHNVSYQYRKSCLTKLDSLILCLRTSASIDKSETHTPHYLLWTEKEQNYWPNESPVTLPFLGKTDLPELYAINYIQHQ